MSGSVQRLEFSSRLALAVVVVLFATFVGWPLWQVLERVLGPAPSDALPLGELLTRAYVLGPLRNSLLLAAAVAAASAFLGLLLALGVSRTSLPGRGVIDRLATLPVIAPPFVIALSAILLLGRNGLISRNVFFDGLGIDLHRAGFDIYGFVGLFLVETLSYFPTAYLVIIGVLRAQNPALEEAALSLGASRWTTFRRVTLPLAAPGLAAGALLVFVESMADFGNPLILGGRFHVLSVQAYLQIVGVDDARGGSTLALLLLVPALSVYLFQHWLLGRFSFVTVTGKPTRPRPFPMTPGTRRALAAACWSIVGVVTLFYGLVLVGALVRRWGLDASLTTENFAKALSLGGRDLADSLWLALLATPVTAAMSVLVAWLLERKRFWGRQVLALTAMTTFAIPGTVVGIGYALAFNQRPIVLTGTAAIIVALFVFRNMPVGLEATRAALRQIDPAIEEAALNLGASPARVLWKVTLPLIAPAVFSSIVYGFVRAMTAVSAVIFVVSGSWHLITVAILGLVEASELGQACALASLLVGCVLLVFEGGRLITNQRVQAAPS